MSDRPILESEELQRILSASPVDDEVIDALVSRICLSVCRAVLRVNKLPHESHDEVLYDMQNVLHWAIHVGQDCWVLLDGGRTSDFLLVADGRWWFAMDNLYIHSHIMLNTGDWFRELVLIVGTRGCRTPKLSTQTWMHNMNHHAHFTDARLSTGNIDAVKDQTIPELLLGSLYNSAGQYINGLDWLVSNCRNDRAMISDCFINLCILSLRMSSDAVRFLWP